MDPPANRHGKCALLADLCHVEIDTCHRRTDENECFPGFPRRFLLSPPHR